MRRRFGRGGLAAGVAVVVVAATGVASAGDVGSPQSREQRDVLVAPEIDVESARGLALRYLVGQGMSPERARRRMTNQHAALEAVTELRTRARSGVGSVWLDEDGNLKVRVLDDAGAREARAVGATPVFGTLAVADLEAARDALIDDAMKNPSEGLSGAVFEIDEAANKVIARYLFEKSGGVVPQAATELRDLVTASVEVASLNPQADVQVAGATIERDDTLICTAGWAVDIPAADGGVPKNGVMTSGHCFHPDSDPGQTKYIIDTASEGNTPATGMLMLFGEEGDYGVLELTNGDRGRTTMVNSLHIVEAIQEPVVGAIVCKDGATTGQTCGEIQQIAVSTIALVPEGFHVLIRGLVRANFCSVHGDSGAPVYAEFDEGKSVFAVAAIGLVSSGVSHPGPQGDRVCGEKVGKPNESYFMPVSDIDTEGRFFIRIDGG